MKTIDLTKEQNEQCDGVEIIFSENVCNISKIFYEDGEVRFADIDGDDSSELFETDIPELIQALQLLQKEIA